MGAGEFSIPINCTGIAVLILKRIENQFKVLLLKRATSVLRDAWCYIGGGIEEGETAWEAALREIWEETGIESVALYTSNKFDQFYSVTGNYIYVAPVFVGYVDEKQEVKLNHEHSEYRWLLSMKLSRLSHYQGTMKSLDLLRSTSRRATHLNGCAWVVNREERFNDNRNLPCSALSF